MKNIKIQQIKNGVVVYDAEIENYDYSVPQFLKNGATKIIIEYPTSTITVQPIPKKVEVT